MKYSEYESIAKTLTPENAPEVLKLIMEGIKQDTECIDVLTKSNEEKDIKIRDLQDTNIKLFLSQTGKAEDGGSEDEPSAEETKKAVENEIENILKGD